MIFSTVSLNLRNLTCIGLVPQSLSAKDGGEILLIDKLMAGGIVFHKHNF